LSQGLEAVLKEVSQQHLETSEAMSQQWSDHQQSLSQQWQASQGVLESRFSSMTESLQASMSELITVTTGASRANAELLSSWSSKSRRIANGTTRSWLSVSS